MYEKDFWKFLIIICAMIIILSLFCSLCIYFYTQKNKRNEALIRSIDKAKERIITAQTEIELHHALHQLLARILPPRPVDPSTHAPTRKTLQFLYQDGPLWSMFNTMDEHCSSLSKEQKQQILLSIHLHQTISEIKRMNNHILRFGLLLPLSFLLTIGIYFFLAECGFSKIPADLSSAACLIALAIFSLTALIPAILFQFLKIRSKFINLMLWFLLNLALLSLSVLCCVGLFQMIEIPLSVFSSSTIYAYGLCLSLHSSLLSFILAYHSADNDGYRVCWLYQTYAKPEK